jgi:2-oxo-4-hydroxy-4-carboxy-5-ureidoimidazoline decarboxylase
MTPSYRLSELNQCDAATFVAILGGVFEHSPWVAEAVADLRPFQSVPDLHGAMAAAVRGASDAVRLRLICAHPELAGKAAIRGTLTAESSREQSGAGLDQCHEEEFAQLQRLNADYHQKFGFPFIIAVRGHDRQSIIRHFMQRLTSDRVTEMNECIEQIIRIGGFRLTDLIVNEN